MQILAGSPKRVNSDHPSSLYRVGLNWHAFENIFCCKLAQLSSKKCQKLLTLVVYCCRSKVVMNEAEVSSWAGISE